MPPAAMIGCGVALRSLRNHSGGLRRHRAFASTSVHKNPPQKGFGVSHHFFGLKRYARAPAVNGDVSPGSVRER